jgi:hypothetical protein
MHGCLSVNMSASHTIMGTADMRLSSMHALAATAKATHLPNRQNPVQEKPRAAPQGLVLRLGWSERLHALNNSCSLNIYHTLHRRMVVSIQVHDAADISYQSITSSAPNARHQATVEPHTHGILTSQQRWMCGALQAP